MRSISGSLTKGITGETLTPTGMPAAASVSIVRSRRCGAAARGSRMRANAGSSVVTDTTTAHNPRTAIGASRSRSRSTPDDLVTITNGCAQSDSTSTTPRVMRKRRSTGCQASVAEPRLIDRGR